MGNKGKHGKWCVAEYDIPIGSCVRFQATANGKDSILEEFFVKKEEKINIDGYDYRNEVCGWIVSI